MKVKKGNWFSIARYLVVVCIAVFGLITIVGTGGGGGGGGGSDNSGNNGTYSISGKVTADGSALKDVTITLSGTSSATATTDAASSSDSPFPYYL